jgi:hypothetical protein
MKSFTTLGKKLLQPSASTFQNRFFSHFSSPPVQLIRESAAAEQIKKLMAQKEQQTQVLQRKYPLMLSRVFNREVVYALRTETPTEMIATGGLIPSGGTHTPLSWSIDSGNNTGFVCFSLLPEVSVIFREKKLTASNKRSYIYAFPLDGLFWLPGGPWRQVCSPGGFPIPSWWRAREVLDVSDSQVQMGPVIGQGEPLPHSCQRFERYLRNTLYAPILLNRADEDYPEIYEIIDTPETELFQKQVAEHYQKKSAFTKRPT